MYNIPHQNIYFSEKGKASTAPLKKTAFTAIDISTPAKGPLFTIVKGDGKLLRKDLNFCKIRMDYYIKDAPIDERLSFDTYADFSYTDPHELYPLILQIMNMNEFLENQGEDDHRIYLDQIYIDAKSNKEVLKDEFSDKKLRKVIEKYGIITDVSSVVGDKSFILLSQRNKYLSYTLLDELPPFTSFGDTIMGCFPEIETCIMIRNHVYNDLVSLNGITITVTNENKIEIVDRTNLADGIIEKRNFHSKRVYHAITIDQIFKLFIYVPQITRIERVLYNVDTTIEITLERMGKMVTLKIMKDEYHVNFDLFNAVCSMLHLIR